MIRKALPLGLIALLLLQGCTHLPKPRPWTKTEKMILVASVAAAAADYYTTERSLDRGYGEMNPVIGKYPTDTELTIKGWGCYGLFLILAHYWPKMRKPLLCIQTGANAAFAVHNSKLD